MMLRVVGDAIVSDEGDLIATFNADLLATRRDIAERTLFLPNWETDADLRLRIFEYEDRIAELEQDVIQLKELLEVRDECG
jgi:hypothetical protein